MDFLHLGSADSIQSTLEGIEEKFEKCNDKLASVSVGPCSYQFQANKIEKMTQDLQTLQRYAGSQQIAWMLGAATGCIVSTAGMNLVFRNPKRGNFSLYCFGLVLCVKIPDMIF